MQLTEFGGLVRSVRLSKNITQKDLAVAVGLSRATISALESGKIHELGYTRVYAIGAYLGLELGCKHAAARSASTSALLERLALFRPKKEQESFIPQELFSGTIKDS